MTHKWFAFAFGVTGLDRLAIHIKLSNLVFITVLAEPEDFGRGLHYFLFTHS